MTSNSSPIKFPKYVPIPADSQQCACPLSVSEEPLYFGAEISLQKHSRFRLSHSSASLIRLAYIAAVNPGRQ